MISMEEGLGSLRSWLWRIVPHGDYKRVCGRCLSRHVIRVLRLIGTSYAFLWSRKRSLNGALKRMMMTKF